MFSLRSFSGSYKWGSLEIFAVMFTFFGQKIVRVFSQSNHFCGQEILWLIPLINFFPLYDYLLLYWAIVFTTLSIISTFAVILFWEFCTLNGWTSSVETPGRTTHFHSVLSSLYRKIISTDFYKKNLVIILLNFDLKKYHRRTLRFTKLVNPWEYSSWSTNIIVILQF